MKRLVGIVLTSGLIFACNSDTGELSKKVAEHKEAICACADKVCAGEALLGLSTYLKSAATLEKPGNQADVERVKSLMNDVARCVGKFEN
jgi:hypothetical protein